MSSISEGMFGDDELLDENLRKWFKEKWVRFGPDGKIKGPCARGSEGEGKPKCLPQKKAHALGKKGRKYAAAKKRREDPNPERQGKAKNVATKKKTNENMSEDQAPMFTPESKCPHCGGQMYPESMINEKKDACYYKVKSRYKIWPSAYASGALVKCRKKGASNWGTKSESSIIKGLVSEVDTDNKSNLYPMTYVKLHTNTKDPYAEIHHVTIDFGSEAIKTPERAAYLVKNSPKHKELKDKGYNIDAYGVHKNPDTYYSYPVKITREITEETDNMDSKDHEIKRLRNALEDISRHAYSEEERYSVKRFKNDYEAGYVQGWIQAAVYAESVLEDKTPVTVREEPDTSGPVGTQFGGWRRTDMDEDTAYAGGMGQGGNAGQSYRKYKPKVSGTHESSIMKGIQRESK